jgi:alkylated DNA repair protein alkB family protein 8
VLRVYQAAPYDQLTVNEYLPGAGIPPHVDTHSAFRGALASLSLGGPCAMLFRRGDDVRALLLPPRSLLLLAGEARFAWQHYIPGRMADPVAGRAEPLPRAPRRVSFTFRRTVPAALRHCACPWPEECDTAIARREADEAAAAPEPAATPAEDGRRVPAVEQAHVRELYERIAPHFSATRFAVWPAVRRFLTSLPTGAVVVDAGCGNGKYLAPGAAGGTHLALVGTDAARGLLRLAARAGGDGCLAQADAAALPLRSGCADAVICIAVLHHLSSEARRLAALSELARCLRPGGRALVTVWALEQAEPERTLRKWEPIGGGSTTDEAGGAHPNREYFVPWHLPLHRPEYGAAARAAAADAAAACPEAAAPPRLDEAKGAVVFRRYYHLFEAGELAALAGRVPGLRIEAEFFDASNWVIEVTKVA